MSSLRSSSKGSDHRFDPTARLAGGSGAIAAKQKPEALLARASLACMLWENTAYESGSAIAKNIATLIPQCDPKFVADLALKAREEQGLRHVPLLLLSEMSKDPTRRGLVGTYLPLVIQRPDEISEYLAITWRNGKHPLAHHVKKGLGEAFGRFDEYQLAKWQGEGKDIKLRDALLMVHPKPADEAKSVLYKKLLNKDLAVPVTRETMLSSAKTSEEKAKGFTDMITANKMGASALLKSLRLMEEVGVTQNVIKQGLSNCKPGRLLPLDFIKAHRFAPKFERELDGLMIRCLSQFTRLPGRTVLVLDCSGSMGQQVSSKSEFSRLDAAIGLGVMTAGMCEHLDVYLTAGQDYSHVHKTEKYSGTFGLGMAAGVHARVPHLGGGGIFTRQALEYVRTHMGDNAKKTDRIIVISDSADCDLPNKRIPNPFGNYNYIVDINSLKNGINYDGVWTQEITGWSPMFIEYIAQSENLQKQYNLF